VPEDLTINWPFSLLVPDTNATVGSAFSTPGIILAIVEGFPALIVTEEKAGLAGRDATPTGAPLIVESPVIAPPSVKSTEEMLVRSA